MTDEDCAIAPRWKALGNRQLPRVIDVAGLNYAWTKTFKDDFFAVTALYEGVAGKVILKIARQAAFFLIPLSWIGRILAFRERQLMQLLAGVEGIPRFIDRFGPTGFVREFIDGHALRKGEHVADDFHVRLRTIVDEVHRRGAAYVDLEKCENVIVGDNGRPYLCDFQIAWYVPARWGGNLWPLSAIGRWFQRGDCYHLVKLQRRTRPDQLDPEALERSYLKPWYVRVHGWLSAPFRKLRRAILRLVDPRRKVGERGRVAD